MNAVTRVVTLVGAALLIMTSAFAADSSSVPPDLVPDGYRVTERHGFNLGAESGSYTDWHRYDLESFEGLATVLEIPLIYGKAKDKWAAIAKIRFLTSDNEKASFALVFMADRKTKQIHALFEHGDELNRFDVTFALKDRVQVVVTRSAPDKLEARIGSTRIEIPAPHRIDEIALAGSGLDVTFEPFVMLGKKSDSR